VLFHSDNREISTQERMRLMHVVSCVSTLSHWEPIGTFVEDVKLALSEGACIAHKDLDRVARWAGRWDSLDRRLRAFYSALLHDPDYRWAAEAALWSILKGNAPAKSNVYFTLKNRWLEMYNEPPSIEIIPTRIIRQ